MIFKEIGVKDSIKEQNESVLKNKIREAYITWCGSNNKLLFVCIAILLFKGY
jgi:hypothetical protein